MRLTRKIGSFAGAVLLVAAGGAIGFIARGELPPSAGGTARNSDALPPAARSVGNAPSTLVRQTNPLQAATSKMVNIGLNRDGHEAEAERGDDSEGGR